MSILFYLLDLVCMTWFFFPLVVGLTIGTYFIISSSVEDNDDFPAPAAFLLGFAGSAILYRYPAVRHLFTDWKGWAEVAAGYVIAGFVLSLYKWIIVLMDFRKLPVAIDISTNRADVDLRCPQNHYVARLNEAATQLSRQRCYAKCVVNADTTANTITIYPDWHKFPIATWWSFWPFFLFSVVLDPVKRSVERLLSWCRAFYDGLARRFAVRG